jgi:glycosyltransferase involved in cell wall biosynthesis
VKIAIHAVYYHPEVGGMESHIKDIAEEFVERGHEVRILCAKSLPGLADEETIRGVRVTRVPWFGRHRLGWSLFGVSSVGPFKRIARDADVVHSQDLASGLATRAAKARFGIPEVITIHSSHFLKLAPKKILGPAFRYLFRPADHMLAASNELADAVRSVMPGRQVECYVNSVNTKVFRRVEPALKNPGKTVLVCPRRLVEKNGVRYAIEALPLIQQDTPAHLYMAGPGPLRAELEELARKLGVADSVTFLGSQTHDSMPGILSSADVIVIPSLMEATSIAALESMACERVIAASNVGGLPEIIDSEIGALFNPADPADIAAKVKLLLGRDRAAMGRTARERVVRNWSAARLADRHLEIYTALLANRPARG